MYCNRESHTTTQKAFSHGRQASTQPSPTRSSLLRLLLQQRLVFLSAKSPFICALMFFLFFFFIIIILLKSGADFALSTFFPSLISSRSQCRKPCWHRYFLQCASRADTPSLPPHASPRLGFSWLAHLSRPSKLCGRDSNNPLVFPALWIVRHGRQSSSSSSSS